MSQENVEIVRGMYSLWTTGARSMLLTAADADLGDYFRPDLETVPSSIYPDTGASYVGVELS